MLEALLAIIYVCNNHSIIGHSFFYWPMYYMSHMSMIQKEKSLILFQSFNIPLYRVQPIRF